MKKPADKIRFLPYLALLLFFMTASEGCHSRGSRGNVLSVFAGTASRPALMQIAAEYEKKRGIKVELNFGASGVVLSQMILVGSGDVYVPGSSDFMKKAVEKNVVDPSTEQIAAYLIPAINVKPGNPKGITSLEDLARPGTRVGIARPEQVCLGLYAVELFEAAGLMASIGPNIIVTTESCAKTASAIAISGLDAVIGWQVFQSWSPARIESVPLPPEQLVRVGYIPMAVTRFTKNREIALDFISYATGPEGRAVFKEFGYVTDRHDIDRMAPFARIGGDYILPKNWRTWVTR